jgi:very-short-patch-repair endonuclease
LGGYKFVREYIIGPYIVDFVCREKRLVIEIDGRQHMEAVEYDQKRTEYLEAKGYKVVRFWNNDVFSSVQVVLERILYSLEDSAYPPSIP